MNRPDPDDFTAEELPFELVLLVRQMVGRWPVGYRHWWQRLARHHTK